MLTDNGIDKDPNALKFPIEFKFDTKIRIAKQILFILLSLVLPVLGAVPRFVDSNTHGLGSGYCPNSWKLIKCFVVILYDLSLFFETWILINIFNGVLVNLQSYFKEVEFLTDLIIDNQFTDGTIGSSNIIKSCCKGCFKNEQNNLFLYLNSEQNQLAWFACRSYVNRKGVIILGMLETHILLLIVLICAFTISLVTSVFWGYDINGNKGSYQTYYKNAAILGDGYIILVCFLFFMLILFKGSRFQDINDIQLSRLQRQRSNLSLNKLKMCDDRVSRLFQKGISANINTPAMYKYSNNNHGNTYENNNNNNYYGHTGNETSEEAAQIIVDSLERIINDCTNLDMCPLFLGQKLNRVGWGIAFSAGCSAALSIIGYLLSSYFG